MIELLGLAIFATILGVGLLDAKSGLSPFAMYRSAPVPGFRRPASATGLRGDDQPTPPAPSA